MKDNLRKEIALYYEKSHVNSGAIDLKKKALQKAFVEEALGGRIGSEIINILRREYPDLSRLILLDLGCGLGNLLVNCQNAGIKSFGIDIDPEAVAIARKRVKEPNNLVAASGEKIPFPDNSFDVVTSTCVIEHVSNPQKYLQESFRVLKNKGLFIIYAPNYLFPWEGHYKMFWLPYALPFSKIILRPYLYLRNRRPEFLNHLNLKITPRWLIKKLRHSGFQDIKDLSTERFLGKINQPTTIANPGLDKIVLKLKKNKLTNFLLKIFIISLKISKLYHPLIFTARVKKDA